MVYHARSTRAGVKHALLIVDMPFLTYQVSPQRALLNCGRVMAEGGADAVKVEGASATVLAGPHGDAVRKAAADRATILGIVASLEKPDRELLPEIVPTVNALVERSAALAVMLHHLDSDVSPEMVAQLETRIAAVEREPDKAADRERRLGLLQRQRGTLRELADFLELPFDPLAGCGAHFVA